MHAMNGRLVALAGLALAAACPLDAGAAGGALSVQEATLRAKPATVLIISEVASDVAFDCGSGPTHVGPGPFRETGTGWFVDSAGHIVTNAHVVEPAHAPPHWLVNQLVQRAVTGTCVPLALGKRGIAPGERPDVEEQIRRRALDRVVPAARIELRPSISVLLSNGLRLPARVLKYSPPVSGAPGVMSGRDLALLRVEASDMPALAVADSRTLKIGDPVRILGFPGVVLSHELLSASSKVEASVTAGAISGFKQDVSEQPVIQTDAPAAWGNSGGPVVNERSEAIGVLTFVSLSPEADGGIVQGFNFIIPSAAVTEFLAGTPAAVNGRSAFNDAWFAGLRALFSGRNQDALAAFAEANRLVPELPDVKRALAEAEHKVRNPPPRPFPWALATAGVTVVSLSVLAVIATARWRRNRFRVAPADVMKLMDTPNPPVILDARQGSAYAASPFRIAGSIHVALDDLAGAASSLPVAPDRTVVAYCT